MLHSFLYMVKLDAVKRDDLPREASARRRPISGSWVAFSMKIRWGPADRTGWIKVSCGDHIVYADEGIATDQPPQSLHHERLRTGRPEAPEEASSIGARVR